MPLALNRPAASSLSSATPATRPWPLWLALASFALLWLDLCRQLSYEWSTNEQYAYGWFVPILAVGLFMKKWSSRPPPAPPSAFTFHPSALAPRLSPFSFHVSPFTFQVSAFCFLLLLLPLRVIHEINQDWSFCGYLLTSVVVALSLYAVFLTGGWPWVRHFAFPICFILVAVNWPNHLELSLKYRAMSAVASLTVEIAGWLNIPALQHGNVIELATSSVGVEDACSGIRSFQSTVMGALFLGELYLLRWPHRFLLLALGVPLAFSFNIVRTLFLTWQASISGGSAVAKWHDSAGITISVACFACLWLLATYVSKKTVPSSSLPAPTQNSQLSVSTPQPSLSPFSFQLSALPACPPTSDLRPPTSDLRPLTSKRTFHLSAFSFPTWFSLSLALWVPLVLVATEAWYRVHDSDPAQTVRWTVQFPTNSANALEIRISKEIRQILKCDQGSAFSWDEQDGNNWLAYFFRWREGEATSRMAARDHRPEMCLPSRGYKATADSGIHFLPASGLELPFRCYTFTEESQVLYVFFCLWEDGAEKQAGLGKSKYLDRLDSALAGRRRLGQQTLEIVLRGYQNMPDAEQAVRLRLPSLVRPGA